MYHYKHIDGYCCVRNSSSSSQNNESEPKIIPIQDSEILKFIKIIYATSHYIFSLSIFSRNVHKYTKKKTCILTCICVPTFNIMTLEMWKTKNQIGNWRRKLELDLRSLKKSNN